MTSKLDSKVTSEARAILKDGILLQTTEGLALKLSNGYDFTRRVVQEYSLIASGQIIQYLDVGQLDRAYSHAGLYAPPGLGKDYAWKLIQTSGIFPSNIFRTRKLDNVTLAALSGTITESTVVPPPTLTEDIIFVGEFATFMRGSTADSIAADLRAVLESGQYSRRLAKVGQLKEIVKTQPNSKIGQYVRQQLETYKNMGMTVDLDRSEISVKTSSSWIVSSARFGSETGYGRSLLNMGDINRFRWRAYLPNRKERIQITLGVGSLPPLMVSAEDKRNCRDAWATLITNQKGRLKECLIVPRDEQSYYSRQKVWGESQKILKDNYGQLDNTYYGQLVNLRTRAEFTRIMYQHAVLKQYERNQGYDFSLPSEFVIDYKEDGAFAQQLWISEYVPSMIDVMNDITKRKGRERSVHNTLTSKGALKVLERLEKGPATRKELIEIVGKIGINPYLLDNQILPRLLECDQIQREKHGVYSLVQSK